MCTATITITSLTLKLVYTQHCLPRFPPSWLDMNYSTSSPHSRGNRSPLRVSAASARQAMNNEAPGAFLVDLESSDDSSVDSDELTPFTLDLTDQYLRQLQKNVHTLLLLPLSLDAVNPSSHGQTSDDDYVPTTKLRDSATTSPKKLRTSSLPPVTAPQPLLHTNIL